MIALVLAALLAQPAPPVTVADVEIGLPASEAKLSERAQAVVSVRKGQQLSARALRASLEALYLTGKFGDASVSLLEVEGGVVVRFELTPRQTVRELYVEGNRSLPAAELIAATRLAVGGEYWRERADTAAEAVAELYARRGWPRAVVTPQITEGDEGLSVGFEIVEGDPLICAGVSFVGEPGLPVHELTALLGLRPGELVDRVKLGQGVERVRDGLRRRRHFRARVEAAAVDADGTVTVPVVAGPQYDVVFSGNRSVASTALEAVVGFVGEEVLDSQVKGRLEDRVRRWYQYRGFVDASVRVEEVHRPGTRRAALGFAIDEGRPLRVVSVVFRGNHAVRDGELRDVLRGVVTATAPASVAGAHGMGDDMALEGRTADVPGEAIPAPPAEAVFVLDAWLEAAKAMGALYRERGYLEAKATFAGLDVADGQGRGRFDVYEGPRVSFGEVRAVGLPAGRRSDAVTQVRSGAPFSEVVLDAARQGVLKELGRQGYLFASATAGFTVQGSVADCTIAVTPGPRVLVRKVIPVGNVRMRDELLLAQATMREGEPLDSEALVVTQSNLLALGTFRTVQVEMLAADTPEPLKTVLLKVKEFPQLSGELGAGYFLAEGPRVVLDLNAPNLLRTGFNANAHAQVNLFTLSSPALSGQVRVVDLAALEQFGFRVNASVQRRGSLPTNLGFRGDFLAERVFRPQFRFTRAVLAVPAVDWATSFELPVIDWVRPKVSLQLQPELEFSRVSNTSATLTQDVPLTLVDQERLRFLFGSFSLWSLRLSSTLDVRDNALVPRKGFIVQATTEVVGAIESVDEAGAKVPVGFLKVFGLATAYVPVTKVVGIALSARAGRIFPLLTGAVTPPVRRFFLGGATSMRGFNEDQLIAEDLRAQYRTEVRECASLAVQDGCSSPAKAIGAGRQVPSQGGELFALFKTELRFPALAGFDLGLFFEAGNLFLSAPTVFPLRTVAGAGLRYVTPIGPLAVDVGVNLAPDVALNEPRAVVHFNIGVF